MVDARVASLLHGCMIQSYSVRDTVLRTQIPQNPKEARGFSERGKRRRGLSETGRNFAIRLRLSDCRIASVWHSNRQQVLQYDSLIYSYVDIPLKNSEFINGGQLGAIRCKADRRDGKCSWSTQPPARRLLAAAWSGCRLRRTEVENSKVSTPRMRAATRILGVLTW